MSDDAPQYAVGGTELCSS